MNIVTFIRHFWFFLSLVSVSTLMAAEPPVAFPDLPHFAPLWERSIFTTRDLPSPDAPAGPLFTDALSLAGVYEVDGQAVAVLVDRTTSQISEARLGTENESGIKIRKVTPGATMDKTRVQLQKGDVAGWVGFADVTENPAPSAQASPALETRPAVPVPQAPITPLLPPASAMGQASPGPSAGGRPAAPPSDVPLPPP
ncbi:hypothetical protein SAMN02745166_03203 [Prosthecobacter debontii]|uniref:Uncharacterized protein n=1 Tax=Prosthecobacter debontii TaxID=48467 RepID=A0A1T4YFU4_9BACT|nr:hypothetical protein [Prosthecobacter debontii]SKB00687.1 hypothetical protein SAMN02745166_03203 [Prosthecobacter debontii]